VILNQVPIRANVVLCRRFVDRLRMHFKTDGGSEGARYVATALDENAITFGPIVKARNSFVWKRESKDIWTAIIQPLATPDKPSKDIIYKMERLPDAR
jgi:hypothetical protein